MPESKFNFKLLFLSFASMLDDALILTVVLIILSRFGVHIPVWLIIFIGALLVGWVFISFLAVKRNPQLGFENMIGATGLTLDSLSPKGTIRIGHEEWVAKARGGNIGQGVEVVVVDQSGLLLIVIKKVQMETGETKP